MTYFNMLYPSILVWALLLFVEVLGNNIEFQIRHKLSGMFIGGLPDQGLLFRENFRSGDTIWNFESVDDEWGYIRNIYSDNYLMCPINHAMYPSEGTEVVIQTGEHPYSLFALDQINNRIIHYGGKYLHPANDYPEPPEFTNVYLHGNVNEMMEFELTTYGYQDKIVYPYGDAEIAGEWVLVFSVDNPLATHTYEVQVSIGKSESASTSDSFQFVWEGSAGAQAWFAQMSTSTSLSNQIEQSSSQTWTIEVTVTHTIQVLAGQSVASWQKHFYGEQLGHLAVHQSNMFQDTEGPHIKPGDDVNAEYYFI